MLWALDTGTAMADRACHRSERERLADFTQRASTIIADAEVQPADGCAADVDAQLTVIAPVDQRLPEVRHRFTSAGWAPPKHGDPDSLASPDGQVTASFWYVLGADGRVHPKTGKVSITMQDFDFSSGND